MSQSEVLPGGRIIIPIVRLALWIMSAQILFWGLFYVEWPGSSTGFDIDHVEFSSFELAELPRPTAQAADAAPHAKAELPYTDCCDAAYLSLRAHFDLDQVPAEGLGLIAFQQVDNFIIRANGSVIHQMGRMEFGDQTFHGQRAYLVRIPAGLLKTGSNIVSFITVRDGYPTSDLIAPLMGPYEQVRAATHWRFWQTIDLRYAGGWLTFALGLFGLLLLFRSRSRRLAAWLVALCWSWTVFAAYGLYFDLPFGGTGRMIAFFSVSTAVATSLLGLIDAWTGRPLKALQLGVPASWLIFNAVSIALLTQMATPQGFDLSSTGWAYYSLFIAIAIVARLVWHFARTPENRHLEAALISIFAACLALDAIGEYFGLLAGGYLMDSAPLLLLAFVVAFLQRNFTLFRSAMELNDLLEATVQARETELLEAHSRERDLVQREAHREERRRLMRDMHDGVGGQLVSLLLAVRRGSIDQSRVADGLQEVMDEVRLMLDSVDATTSSLGTMLDLFEARTRARANDMGVSLVWQNDVGHAIDIVPQRVLQLFRIMQESVTNTLKHAQADQLTITVSANERALNIIMSDNGKGISETDANGHGWMNMRLRAAGIGAMLDIANGPDGVCTNLGLPLVSDIKVAA